MHTWIIFSVISCLSICAFFVWAAIQRRTYNRNKILAPHIIVTMGVGVAAFIWFLPIFGNPDMNSSKFEIFASSVLSTVKLFAADGFKGIPDDVINTLPMFYKTMGHVLSVSAPFLTITFILSFFKRIRAYAQYYRSRKDAYIFSELNDKSLALAKSIKNGINGKKCIIVFADILDRNEEAHLDLVDGAKEINAILFRNDLEAIKWAISSKIIRRKLNFYLISDDESEKIRHAKSIVERYNVNKCSLTIFSNSEESKNLLTQYNKNKDNHPIHININRIDAVRLLTYGYLKDNGIELFESATNDDGLKVINTTIVGFGNYGTEMLKALLWYCQMPGYKINITVIDRDESAQSRFSAMLPGLVVGENFNNSNDMRYHIEFKTCTFGEKAFIDVVQALPDNNFFFVSLGSDKINMLASDAIRSARAQAASSNNRSLAETQDHMTTIVYSADVKKLISTEVMVIGDLDSFYSYNTFTGNKLITDGFEEHRLWSNTYNIYVFGFGYKEALALKRLIAHCQGKRHQICLQIFTKTDDDDESARFEKEFPELEASFVSFNKEDFCSVAQSYDSLIIHFDGNDIAGSYETIKSLGVPVLRAYSTAAVESYFKSREDERDEIDGNEYRLSTYNFYSSISKALHRSLRKQILDLYGEPYREALNSTKTSGDAWLCNKQIKKSLANPDEKLVAEKKLRAISEIEHVRWNAYMRTEGFVYSHEKKREFKMHNNLVGVDDLLISDCIKDI